MRGAAAPVIGSLVALTGCSAGTTVVPEVPNPLGHPTEILAIGAESSDAPEAIYVIDLRAGAPPLTFDLPRTERRLEAYLLSDGIDELDLDPGLQPLESGDPPREYEAFVADFAPGASIAWAMEPSPTWLTSIRIPNVDAEACIAAGRCFKNGLCRAQCGLDPEPALPMPPEDQMVTCPSAWTEAPIDPEVDFRVCDPGIEAEACPTGQMRLPGETDCADVAPPCGPDEYAPLAMGETGVRVASTGTSGGNGSIGAPFDTITNAAAAANDGDVILVSSGMFEGATLTRPLTIRGACPQRTTIGRLNAQADITVEGTTLHGLAASADATLRRVVVAGGANVAIVASSTLTLDRIALHGDYAVGIDARELMSATDVYVAGPTTGIVVAGDATLARGRVRAEQEAVLVQGAATLREVTLAGSFGLDSEGGIVVLRVAAIQATVGARFDGGIATLEDVWIMASRTGIRTDDAEMRATNLAVTDTEESGVAVRTHTSSVTLDGVAMVDLDDTAVLVSRSEARVRNIIVRRAGSGLSSFRAEDFTVDRALLVDIEAVAVSASEFSNATLRDIRVDGAGAGACRMCTGFCVGDDGTATVDRIHVSRVAGAAVGVDRPISASLSNVTVQGTTEGMDCMDASGGAGVVIDGGGITFERFRIEDSARVGLNLENTQGQAGTQRVENGRIVRAQFGLEVLLDGDWAERVVGVDIEDVERALLTPD